MKLSDEQLNVVDAFNSGQHVSITAGAGTGKTTTLKVAAEQAPGNRMLYVAFNKAIQREAEKSFPQHVQCSTAHSIAWQAGGKRYKRRLDAPRMATGDIIDFLQAEELTVWFEDERDGAKRFSAGFATFMAMKTVERFCQSADREITTKHVPRVDGLDTQGKWDHNRQIQPAIVKLARKAWIDLVKYEGSLRFTHDMYLKIFQLSDTPDKMRYDVVFADEAQDLSPVMIDVFRRQAKRGAQVVAVGDSNQAIYGWRGAVDGMYMVEGAVPAQLSWCWRFGEEIAVPVNSMLGQLDSELRLVGKGERGVVGLCPDARVVLARTNAAIIREAMVSMEMGRRFAIVGNMPRSVIAFAEGAERLQAGQRSWHPELHWAESWAEVLRYVETDQLGEDLVLMVTLVEEYGTQKIIDAMRAARDESTAERVYSTMHAAKGREWPEVRLLGDYPVDKATGLPALDREAMRLYYVASSRAQQVLDIDAANDVFFPPPAPQAELVLP